MLLFKAGSPPPTGGGGEVGPPRPPLTRGWGAGISPRPHLGGCQPDPPPRLKKKPGGGTLVAISFDCPGVPI